MEGGNVGSTLLVFCDLHGLSVVVTRNVGGGYHATLCATDEGCCIEKDAKYGSRSVFGVGRTRDAALDALAGELRGCTLHLRPLVHANEVHAAHRSLHCSDGLHYVPGTF